MGPENMYGSNSHPFPEPNTQHWGLPQSVNDGSSMINNFTSYPTQGQPLTGFESQGQNHNISTSHPSANMPSMPAQNHNLNTSHPSANMPSMPAQNHNPNTSHPSANMPSMPAQIHNLNTSHPSANMPNMHSPLYGPYGPLPNGEPNLMDFSGNHGSTLKSGLPPTRPQATQAFSNHQTPVEIRLAPAVYKPKEYLNFHPINGPASQFSNLFFRLPTVPGRMFLVS
uniref:Uncharacterized protein n=1 Tax=Bionectria ochroleuca TaxID=29856 RepID=A0A8H7TWE5_BIOOC